MGGFQKDNHPQGNFTGPHEQLHSSLLVDLQAHVRNTKQACSIQNSVMAFALIRKVFSMKIENLPCSRGCVGRKQHMRVGKHEYNTREGARLPWNEHYSNPFIGKSWNLSIANRL